MAPRRRFDIIYAPVVKEHLRFVERKHYPLIRKAIELQLWDAPDQESINRKRLAPTAEVEAEWELRCGPGNRFRVFYWIDSAELKVHVVGMGVKRGDCLRIGGEEVEL